MRTLLTLLALAIAACAPSPEYHRGTLARPPPAQARPGVGAPTYDPHTKPLPPQPQPKPTRMLPPTREPGIWASNDPEQRHGGTPRLLEIDLPQIPNLRTDEIFEHALLTSGCIQTINDRLDFLSLMAPSLELLPEPRRCLAARLYDLCVRRKVDDAVRSRAGTDAVLPRALARTAQDAAEFREKACGSKAMPDADRITGAVERTWDTISTSRKAKR